MRIWLVIFLLSGIVAQAQSCAPAITSRFIGQRTNIFFRLLSFTNTTGNAPSYSNGPIALPTANALLLTAVHNTQGMPHRPSAITGHGLTWTEIYSTNFNTVTASSNRITLYRAMGASPTTNTVMVFFGTTNQAGCAIYTCEFQFVDTSGSGGSGAIVQMQATNLNATANSSLVMQPIGNQGNAVFLCAGNDINPFAGAVGWPMREQWDVGFASTTTGSYVSTSGFNSTSNLVVTRASADWGAIAVEIKTGP